MKAIKIKYQKILMGIFICLIGAVTFAQNTMQKDKLSYHSFSLTPLEIFFTDYSGGAAITAELSYGIDSHVFTLSASAGEEIGIFSRGDRFQQLNILYGRELKLKEWLFIDIHGGAGLFLYNNNSTHFTEIGVPLVTKLRFKTGDKFSIGLKFQANINSVNNIYSVGLLLQWNKL